MADENLPDGAEVPVNEPEGPLDEPDNTGRTLSSNVPCSANVIENSTGLLQRIRHPIADYHFEKGIPRSETFSFTSLVAALAEHSWTAVLTILGTLYRLLPLVDFFLYIFRFILDKLIEIYSTEDRKGRLTKIGIFTGQLVVISLIVYFIWSLILMPIISLLLYVVGKVWALIYHRKKPKTACPQVACSKKPAC